MSLLHHLFLSSCLFVSGAQASPEVPSIQFGAELERPVLPAGSPNRTVVKISLLPDRIEASSERPDLNLAIALDQSGSMGGEKIEQAKDAALEALSLIGLQDRFALVTYSDDSHTLIPSQRPLEREYLASTIRKINAGGSTALYAGVSQAAAELRRGETDGAFNRLILLSDGMANRGPSSIKDLKGLSRSLAGEEISVSTVGLGVGFNEDVMTAIAESAQGNAYFAENANDLARIFAAELDDVLNVAATNVRIVIECAPGVRPLRIIGREGHISGNTISFEINQLFGGQEKFALVEVDLPAGVDGEEMDVLLSKVTYENSLGEEVTGRAVAQVRYTKEEEMVRKAANVEIARAVVDNRVAEAQMEAIRLSDAGDNKAAAGLMRSLRQEIVSINSLYEDAEIADEAVVVEVEADGLEASRLSNKDRKRYSNSSYQKLNQQKEL